MGTNPTPSPAVTPDTYTPLYFPPGLLTVTGYGFTAKLNQVYGLQPASADQLVQVLAQLGFPVATVQEEAEAWPIDPGTSYHFSIMVPWLTFPGGMQVNAGVLATYWTHGVSPFVGSSYENALMSDINTRLQAAANGNPRI